MNDTVNQAEIAKLMFLPLQSDNLPFVIVGSEAILRGDKTPAQVMRYINQVKQAVIPLNGQDTNLVKINIQ